jgi:hypothetical protein
MAGNGIRSVTATRDKSGTTISTIESEVYGYAPVEIAAFDYTKSLMVGITAMSNIDNSLYALIETCN